MIKLDQYIAQANFLGRTGISTMGELLSYADDIEAQMSQLKEERTGLRNQLKQCTRSNDEKGIEEIKARIDVLSDRLSACRKEIKLCRAIAERSVAVRENLEDIQQQKSDRKEKSTDELFVRGSGRTGRENDPQRS